MMRGCLLDGLNQRLRKSKGHVHVVETGDNVAPPAETHLDRDMQQVLHDVVVGDVVEGVQFCGVEQAQRVLEDAL